ncbi:exo-poly-alpha-D-galacturonosidase [Yersinia aldovae]|uniref:hypothetical protein n=1 Tax=Yersinia aldovae TaxID=29483 RepID=UPI0005DD5304|nr:hypothetical protein [Yersinia aldovae]CNI17338.1 exo-poly-alpha-D-galacturonosidase [Yersinia aldovae]
MHVLLHPPYTAGILANLENHNVVANGLIHRIYDANNADGSEFGKSQNVMVFNNVFDTGDGCINFAARYCFFAFASWARILAR